MVSYWDEFPKEVPIEKEVELAEGVENRRMSLGCMGGVDVEIDDPAGISPTKHLS
jgi:hypothetical protein